LGEARKSEGGEEEYNWSRETSARDFSSAGKGMESKAKDKDAEGATCRMLLLIMSSITEIKE
jgi:hypothetical protein